MTDMNVVVLSGRLTHTPNLIKKGDLSILEFSVAVNRSYKERDSENWVNQTSFINMTTFGTKAESLHTKLQKGRLVQIQGRLCQDLWEKDGKKLSELKVIPEKIFIVPVSKPIEENSSSAPSGMADAEVPPNVSVQQGWLPVNNDNGNEFEIY